MWLVGRMRADWNGEGIDDPNWSVDKARIGGEREQQGFELFGKHFPKPLALKTLHNVYYALTLGISHLLLRSNRNHPLRSTSARNTGKRRRPR